MPKYGFGIIADASTAGQQSAMVVVLTAIAALIQQSGDVYTLIGRTLPSTDKEGNPIQVPIEVGVATAFRSNTPRVRINNLTPELLSRFPMTTMVETGDASNDNIVLRHLEVELLSQGCERGWLGIDRTSVVGSPPVALSNFVALNP